MYIFLEPDRTLDLIYSRKNKSRGVEQELGNPSFTPAHVASLQVSEVVKLLLRRGDLLTKKIMFIDMLNNDYDIIEL